MRQFDVFWDCALQLLALAIRAREDGKLLWEEELLKLATEISDQADEMDRHEALSGHARFDRPVAGRVAAQGAITAAAQGLASHRI